MFVPISCRIFLTKLYSLPSPFLTLLQELVAVDLGCVHGGGDLVPKGLVLKRCILFGLKMDFQLVLCLL